MSKVSIEELDGPHDDTDDAGDDRRRTERTRLLVRVEYATVDEMFSEFTQDINEGGLFIETEKPQDVGSEVSLRFNLPGSSDALQTTGRVVWVRSAGGNSPPGMGIEFDELTQEDRDRINEMIRSLRNGPMPASREAEG
jgi:type IV pilus assembly protein PilZ